MQTYNNKYDYSYYYNLNASYNWYNRPNTGPIIRSYDNSNNFNLYNVPNTELNTGPIVRSYNYISNTGDDPFLHIFPYPNELYDNFVTNLTNLYNLETYYLHNK